MNIIVKRLCFCEASQKLTTPNHSLDRARQRTLAARRHFLLPPPLRCEYNTSQPFALNFKSGCIQDRQAQQEKGGVECASVNPTTQSLRCYRHSTRSQQLGQLPGVQAPLSHGILQKIPGKFLPFITQVCGPQELLPKIFSLASPNGKPPTWLRVFELRRARIIPRRVPNMSPEEFLTLYSLPRQLRRHAAFSWLTGTPHGSGPQVKGI